MWLLLLSKNFIVAIPVMLLLGFDYGLVAPTAWLKNLIIPLTFLMLYPMMVSLNHSKVLEGGDTMALVLNRLINFAVIPFIAFGLGRYFFQKQPFYAMGLLLAGLLPTSGMTISCTGFTGGNLGAAVKNTLLGLILGSLATPFNVQCFMGAVPDDRFAVFRQIMLIVFLRMVAGLLTQSHRMTFTELSFFFAKRRRVSIQRGSKVSRSLSISCRLTTILKYS